MFELNWMTALVGGILTGIGATLMLALNGRIAGVSGILNGALEPASRRQSWRWTFLLGMVLGGALYEYGLAATPTPTGALLPITMIVGGFITGFGARMGNGCTSGHGVCGLGRLSVRSVVAVSTFMATAVATVYLTRHMLPTVLPF